MDKNKVLDRIVAVANELAQDKKTCTRSDLAFELKALGVNGDSAELCALVWEAFRKSGNTNVRDRILENDGKSSVVGGQQMIAIASQHDAPSLQLETQRHLDAAQSGLDAVRQILDTSVNIPNVQQSDMLQTLTGSAGVESVRREASSLYSNYASSVDGYLKAKSDVLMAVDDFVTLRTEVADVYRRYVAEMLDIFGDRLRVVAPQLFDFSAMEFLDVANMQKNIELEFNRITDSCGVLLSEVVDSFKNTTMQAARSIQNVGGGQGLALAGLQFVNHYLDAGAKTAELRKQYVTLQTHAVSDVNLIRADVGRLAVVHKTLDELLTPRAVAFLSAADKVMSVELRNLVDSVYSSPEAHRLRCERDEALDACKRLEASVADHRENACLLSNIVADSSQIITALTNEYQEAKSRKPSKPLFFGMDKYRRELAEWSEFSQPVISRYEDALVDRKLANEDLAAHKSLEQKESAELSAARDRLAAVNAKLRAVVSADDGVRRAIAPHLRDLVALVSLAKEIVESRLDAASLRAISLKPYDGHVALSAETRQGIRELCDSFGAHICQGLEEDNQLIAQDEGSASDVATNRQTSQVVCQAVDLVKSLIDLGEACRLGQESRSHFEQQSRALRDEFARQLRDVADKASVMRQIIAKINTGANLEEVKNALLLLSEGSVLLSDSDLDEFLKGDKNIVI